MSTASRVPETWELTGDDARKMLERLGRRHLLRDAFLRLRFADGFSHARSMAFATSLVLVQGLIAIVGLRGDRDATIVRSVVRAIRSAVPGPASRILTDAVTQAYGNGASSRWLPVVLGTARHVDLGVDAVRPARAWLQPYLRRRAGPSGMQKYGLALLLTVTAGACSAVAFVVFAFGRDLGNALGSAHDLGHRAVADGIGLIVVAMALLFRVSPRRRQPAWSWLAYGSALSVVLWSAVTRSWA